MGEGRGELGPAVERIVTLARLDLDILRGDRRAFRLGEGRDRGALGFDPESLCALLGSRDTKVRDENRVLACHADTPEYVIDIVI